MSRYSQSVVERVVDLAQSLMDDMAFELVDVAFASERGRWVLRVYVDKEGGITLDDCARVSRELGTLVEVHELIDHPYTLEVSSPGLDRPLKKEKDFRRALGMKIKIKTIAPIEGQKRMVGQLQEVAEGTLVLLVENKRIPVPMVDIERANLVYEF
jgi:ribosome maturation factor RimP